MNQRPERYPPDGVVVVITTLEGERRAVRFQGSWFLDKQELRAFDPSLQIKDDEVIQWRHM